MKFTYRAATARDRVAVTKTVWDNEPGERVFTVTASVGDTIWITPTGAWVAR